MDSIEKIMSKVSKIRSEILGGKIYSGISSLVKLKEDGYKIDVSIIQDIVDLESLKRHLYDETFIGDPILAVKCLAALKKLDLDIDKSMINFNRYKKFSSLNLNDGEIYEGLRPNFKKFLKTIENYFVRVSDYKECFVNKRGSKISYSEEVILRFPNISFRDLFLQIAFKSAVDMGLSFHWENQFTSLNGDLTGKINWEIMSGSNVITTEDFERFSSLFDRFLNDILLRLSDFDIPHISKLQNVENSYIAIFSKEQEFLDVISNFLEGKRSIYYKSINSLKSALENNKGEICCAIIHCQMEDYELIKFIGEYKVDNIVLDVPFFIFAEPKFYRVLRDSSQLFPGCEYVAPLIEPNLRNINLIIEKISKEKRRFVRLPIPMDCDVEFNEEERHTEGKPISPAGIFLRSTGVIPVMSSSKIEIVDREKYFFLYTEGVVKYNRKEGAAVEFSNIIPYDEFKILREKAKRKQEKMLDTIKRSLI